MHFPRNSIPPMEGFAVIAEYLGEEDGYDVLSNFQGPFSLHTVMARALRVPGGGRPDRDLLLPAAGGTIIAEPRTPPDGSRNGRAPLPARLSPVNPEPSGRTLLSDAIERPADGGRRFKE